MKLIDVFLNQPWFFNHSQSTISQPFPNQSLNNKPFNWLSRWLRSDPPKLPWSFEALVGSSSDFGMRNVRWPRAEQCGAAPGGCRSVWCGANQPKQQPFGEPTNQSTNSKEASKRSKKWNQINSQHICYQDLVALVWRKGWIVSLSFKRMKTATRMAPCKHICRKQRVMHCKKMQNNYDYYLYCSLFMFILIITLTIIITIISHHYWL